MGLPVRFWNYKVSELPEYLIEELKPYIDQWETKGRSHPATGLFLYGDVEIANRAMTIALKSIRRRCFVSNIVSALELNEIVENESDAKLLNCSLLGLYNFGGEFRDKYGYRDSAMSKILNHRNEWQKPTIVVSYLSPEQVSERYPAMVSKVFVDSFTAVRC